MTINYNRSPDFLLDFRQLPDLLNYISISISVTTVSSPVPQIYYFNCAFDFILEPLESFYGFITLIWTINFVILDLCSFSTF